TEKPNGKICTHAWVLERGQALGQRQHVKSDPRARRTQSGVDNVVQWRFFLARAIFLWEAGTLPAAPLSPLSASHRLLLPSSHGTIRYHRVAHGRFATSMPLCSIETPCGARVLIHNYELLRCIRRSVMSSKGLHA